jgi:hypothetical protein
VARAKDNLRGTLETIMGKAPAALAADLVQLQQTVAQLIQPRRDPFLTEHELKGRAAQVLTLKGVWRQTGRELAMINNRLLAEGDSILEFSVEKIESEQVWVSGPGGLEPLTFKLAMPPPDAMADSASASLEVEPKVTRQ